MRFSVIVPFWNAGPWIGRACESLAKQPGDFEFLMVNDESEDSSAEIAKEYAEQDDRFILLDNERHKGPGGARNTGMDHATGEWVTFLDADDALDDKAHEAFKVAANTNAGIVQLNHKRHYTKINKTVLKYINPGGWYGPQRLPELWCMVWNKVYRKDIADAVRFHERLRFGEDELFNLDCLAQEKYIACIDAVSAVHYFDNTESLSRSKTAADLFMQARQLERWIWRQDDAELRDLGCRILAWHWSSKTYREVIGGATT